MAFRKTLIQRLLDMPKASTHSLSNCRVSTSRQVLISPNPPNTMAPDPGDKGFFRRFLHKTTMLRPETTPDFQPLRTNGKLIEKLRGMDIVRDRFRFVGLRPPVESSEPKEGLKTEEGRKLLELARLEVVKARLREARKDWVSYSEFLDICGYGCSDPGQGIRFSKMLDRSGFVIVLGNVVSLRPEQVLKSIQALIPSSIPNLNDPRSKELEDLESQKAVIDHRADFLVRRELWCGLAYMVAQTAFFMRLTFWELSWDVMEPICFFVTSIYFMAGYAFFLRTSKEPSFEGLFHSRFSSKQKWLMKKMNFDSGRYNELRKALYPVESIASKEVPSAPFDKSMKAKLFGASY